MFTPFIARRPWAAALVCFVFGPEFGMLYLNRAWYAIGYFLASIMAAGAAIAITSTVSVKPPSEGILLGLAFRFIAAAHGYVIARARVPDTPVKWYAHWYSAVGMALILPAAVALTIRTYLYQPFDIPSASMEPTLVVGDYFLVSKSAYTSAQPQRGDAVVFYIPRMHSAFVKRVVGLPGDRVQVRNGRLFINGVIAPQRRIEDWVETCDKPVPCHVAQYEETLPGGRVVRLLDRDPDGALDNTEVFIVPKDSYFTLGDNRDNSDDSRADLGFIPRTEITGRVAYRYATGGRLVWQAIN